MKRKDPTVMMIAWQNPAPCKARFGFRLNGSEQKGAPSKLPLGNPDEILAAGVVLRCYSFINVGAAGLKTRTYINPKGCRKVKKAKDGISHLTGFSIA
jgi:hypothetical protein